jgi:hypothetical protein
VLNVHSPLNGRSTPPHEPSSAADVGDIDIGEAWEWKRLFAMRWLGVAAVRTVPFTRFRDGIHVFVRRDPHEAPLPGDIDTLLLILRYV